jgi:PAS domain S-box-containing protein
MTADISFALDSLDREARHLASVREVEAGLERFTRLFQTAPVAAAIISVDDRRVIDVNDALCELHQAPRDQLIGHTTDSLAYRAVSEDRERFYERLKQHGRVRNMPVRMTDGQRRLHVELMNAEPIDYLGRPCFIFMSLDITDMHAAEAARRALDEAKAASDAKTRFLSRISHELRTPLNAVLGFSGLLRLEAADRLAPGQLAQLDHVQQAGWHLLRLINDVLDLSRIEAGQFGVATSAVELAPLLDEALQMSQPLASQGRIALATGYRDAPRACVLADPTRLRQVMLNLLSNGIKYNRADGRVDVQVSCHEGRARIEVADTGIGMSAEQLAHLFEPFNRLGRERQGFEGTGIGLSLTRQLMHLMGGEVHVDSREGHGTRVALTLPMVEPSTPAAPLPETSSAQAPTSAPRGTVLYIEDNAVNSLLVEQLLARWPEVRFIRAMDGLSGLQMARTLQPDLVLMDLQLPDVDGLELLERLRADAALVDTPVIVLSASAMPEDIARARARGASDYWTKPIDFQHFLAEVARALDGEAVD